MIESSSHAARLSFSWNRSGCLSSRNEHAVCLVGTMSQASTNRIMRQPSAKPSAPSSDTLKIAYGYVSSEMNVFLPFRVFLEVQESIRVIQVVLSVYSARSRFRVSRMLVDPGLSALMINGPRGPSREESSMSCNTRTRKRTKIVYP